jgi:hypothetical protein
MTVTLALGRRVMLPQPPANYGATPSRPEPSSPSVR